MLIKPETLLTVHKWSLRILAVDFAIAGVWMFTKQPVPAFADLAWRVATVAIMTAAVAPIAVLHSSLAAWADNASRSLAKIDNEV